MRTIARLLLTVAVLGSSMMTGACEMENSIQQVKAQHEVELMAVPGVVSVGIGKNQRGEPVIIVGVEAERKEISSKIPATLGGYPVEIRSVGKITAQ